MEDTKASILGGCPEEGPVTIVMLALTGRASPHLHNGVIHVGDENTYASYPIFYHILFPHKGSFIYLKKKNNFSTSSGHFNDVKSPEKLFRKNVRMGVYVC